MLFASPTLCNPDRHGSILGDGSILEMAKVMDTPAPAIELVYTLTKLLNKMIATEGGGVQVQKSEPEFRNEAKKLNLDVEPVSGTEVEALLKENYALPPKVVKLATELVRETTSGCCKMRRPAL